MPRTHPTQGGARRRRVSLAATIASLAAFAAITGLALAASQTLKVANNTTLQEPIVVDSKGVTVYALTRESAKHLLCRSSACLKLWPPYKVSKNAKLTKTSGVKGKLGKVHRGSFYQVTLNNMPLYRYSGDRARKGSVAGNGIKFSAKSKWHVIQGQPITGGY
jgi:predicted lipoprotein with Yx(FWY)xxD motif